MKRKIFSIAVLAALVLAILCPTVRAEIVELPWDETGGMAYDAQYDPDVRVYDDPSIHVEWNRIDNADTHFNATIYYANITIANATQIRSMAVNSFSQHKRARVTVMARRANAILAINGDYYGARPNCLVLRQGTVYRDDVNDELDVLLIDEDGDFHVILADDHPSTADKETWNGKKIVNGFTFGPALIVDNEVVLNEAHAPSMSAPESRGWRTAIVQTGHLQYMVVCCRNVGATAQEMIEMIQELTDNVECAYLMDGGRSSQMVFLGNIINQSDREAREITDIIYFASAYQAD